MSQHIVSTNPEVIEKIRTEADYFERNAERMRYPTEQRKTASVIPACSVHVFPWLNIVADRWYSGCASSVPSPALVLPWIQTADTIQLMRRTPDQQLRSFP
jgi:hypothetical protein